MAKRKPAMPDKLRAQAANATARHQKRRIAPDIEVTTGPRGWEYASPYRPSDELAWCSLFYEAFGTRMGSVANAFVNHLARLCGQAFNQDRNAWAPNEDELCTAIAIVQSLSPRNESEAALAAQAVAVHFAAMKVGRRLAETSYPDARTVAALAALGKVYTRQLTTMQQLKGRKTSRQKITVSYEKHEHKHVHMHQGEEENGSQPHAKNGDAPVAPLLSQDTTGKALSLSGSEGKARMPDARGRKGIGSAKGGR